MSSPWKKQPELVADKVLKRAEVSKIAERLQNRLALAQFKTKRGWEDLTLDIIEPKFEEEMRRKRLSDGGDVLSDSSSSASEMHYPTGGGGIRGGLMSSPLKAPLFSDAVGSSSGSTGHRKRTYMTSFDSLHGLSSSSPSKRFRTSPTAHKSFSGAGVGVWRDGAHHQLAQSSPIKPRRHQHFTTSEGPDVSLFGSARIRLDDLAANPLAAHSDDEGDGGDLLPAQPAYPFNASNVRSSPPRTPPTRSRALGGRSGKDKAAKSGEEGADLLLYLAASPSPAVPSTKTAMEPPSTPPPKPQMALPSSMMSTPGGGGLFPNTPGQGFDFSDYLKFTPSPAPRPWNTPRALSSAKTPLSVARRRLTFDEPRS